MLKSDPETYELTMRAHFVCLVGPDNAVSTGENGNWLAPGEGMIAFAPQGTNLLKMSNGSLNGSVLTLSLDAPTYAPGNAGAARVTTEWRRQ